MLLAPRTAARRRSALAGAAVTLLLVAGVAGAAPATAATSTFADDVGEEYTSADIDITRYQVGLTSSALSITLWTTGSSAMPLRGDSTVFVDIETTGDQVADYIAYASDGEWLLASSDGSLSDCDGAAALTVNSASFSIPAACVGNPAQVKVLLGIFTSAGWDIAPNDSLRAFSAPVSAGADTVSPSAVQQSVFRFWSPGFDNAHFFTTGETEAENILYFDDNWTYEGVAFNALQASGSTCATGTAVHRFWSPGFRSHFYTQSATEKNHIVANDRNWQYEGVAYCAYPEPAPGSTPLYRFWSPGFSKHFFTASQAEADHIRANDRNWVYEGVAYHVLP
ncbi:hypothetical protein [Cellulomonas wangsupingiae]|uniref:DUF5648 domain-containing protein n=1 Tax=Cellulomonas wangsupingiae TaxID=2968085 RepID=A0ABY5K4G2_9CELL|nr:hypothetical protein [Cellulomonas wangsupingiae]MCC2335705.1 hypothetical protein [Cellulomonas wangsupingiae]UUI63940.1 hypothetical protein NP075_12445 [Cellulomonas wangsupingiae]